MNSKNNKKKVSSKKGLSSKQFLNTLGVKPSKSRGQNFAINPYLIGEIIEFGNPKDSENIIEFGPGLGALTTGIKKFNTLTLVEIEEKFKPHLHLSFPKAEIIIDDAKTFSFTQLKNPPYVVFGNLPYSASTEILMNILYQSEFVSRAILLFQKEFSQRLAASPGTKSYSSVSVFVQNRCKVRLGEVFDGDQFYPPTKVQSQVVSLEMRDKHLVAADIPDFFELVVRLCFSQRRKKLFNSLGSTKIFTAEQITQAMEEAGIGKDSRAEILSLEEFAKLAYCLHGKVEHFSG